MSPGTSAIRTGAVRGQRSSPAWLGGLRRSNLPPRLLGWSALALLLTMLASACGGSSAPTATVTAVPSALPTDLPTATATPQPTLAATPTLAPTPKVTPTRRTLADTPTPEPTQPPPTAAPVTPGMQTGVNLLKNGGFEAPYSAKGGQEVNVAQGWNPWHFEWAESDFRPEFKPAEARFFANRVHGGSYAQQYFKTWGTYHAGVFQKVSVTPGTRLRFSAYGQAWSRDDSGNCAEGLSCNPADMGMRVGIDPLGGTEPRADSIEWSPQQSPWDQWALFTVEATAKADAVTVFVWSSPSAPRRSQDTYWDDAVLEAVP